MTSSPAQAQRLVLISVFALLGIAAYRGNLSDAQVPLEKRLWGSGVLAVMLGLLADVAPTIAGPFAILIVVGSLTSGGDKAIQSFLGKVSGGSSSSSSATGGGGGASASASPGSTPSSAPPSAHSPGPSSQ